MKNVLITVNNKNLIRGTLLKYNTNKSLQYKYDSSTIISLIIKTRTKVKKEDLLEFWQEKYRVINVIKKRNIYFVFCLKEEEDYLYE